MSNAMSCHAGFPTGQLAGVCVCVVRRAEGGTAVALPRAVSVASVLHSI
jgi:hypothetical protein